MGAVGSRSMLAASLVGAMALAWAEPPGEPARIAADMTAAVAHDPDRFALRPEVTSQRIRLTPPGAPALTSDGRVMTELAAVHVRLWVSRGRTDVGVGVGTIGYLQPAHGVRGEAPTALAGATPLLSVGMRYRVSPESAFFADASGARALPPDTSGGYVATKVGMEWKPATSRFGFDGGALGIHLDSGYKLSLKARRNGVGVYLRGQF